MPTVQQPPMLYRLQPPPLWVIVTAVVAGAVFAAIGLTVPNEPAPSPQRTIVLRPTDLQRKLKTADRNVKKINRLLADKPQERSELPMRTAVVVAQRPSRVAASLPATGIWSADKERWREGWRAWWAQEMARRQ